MRLASPVCVLRRFVFALSLVSCFVPLQGATLERLTLDDMIDKSTSIVRGRIASSFPVTQSNVIYTNYRVQVTERWKGPVQPAVDFVVPGGTIGRTRQTYAGAPNLVEGNEYLLFLWTSSKTGLTFVIGFTQGLFEVNTDTLGNVTVSRGAATEMMLEPVTGRVVQDDRINLRLRDMSTRISSSLARGVKK
jgi:hypothetical protein